MLNAADGAGERAAAVREGDAQAGQPFEHAPEDHRADRQRRFGRHPDEPREPVLRHPLLAEDVPRVNEDARAEVGRGLEDREELRMVEAPPVDVRPDLHTRELQIAHAALELVDREVGLLHRERPQSDESAGTCRRPPRRRGRSGASQDRGCAPASPSS